MESVNSIKMIIQCKLCKNPTGLLISTTTYLARFSDPCLLLAIVICGTYGVMPKGSTLLQYTRGSSEGQLVRKKE